MDTAAYLQRLHYTGSCAPTLDVLRQLHLAHLRTVPFENLSIHHHESITLDEPALFDKIVHRRRGGFCYELNGLFAVLLSELGFQVTRLAARVFGKDGSLGIPFDHLALQVRLESPWLVDVGFGASFVRPIRLESGIEQIDDTGVYRLERDEHRFTLSSRQRDDGSWTKSYQFDETPYSLADFSSGCVYHQTSPESPFTRRSVCSRATPSGRISLTSDKLLTTTHSGTRHETVLTDHAQYLALLREHFDIELGSISGP